MTQAKVRCRVPGCREKPAKGAWALGSAPPFSVMVLCASHGARAEKKGARHMGWRPDPKKMSR